MTFAVSSKGGCGFFLRRHLAEVELIENALPRFERLQVGEVGPERVEAVVALLFFGAVAFVAVLFEEGLQCVQRLICFAESKQRCQKPGYQQLLHFVARSVGEKSRARRKMRSGAWARILPFPSEALRASCQSGSEAKAFQFASACSRLS